jgi:tetratricopeptide (TPR) repeat protein
MYPHDKLDWHISRLERRVEEHPEDAAVRVQLAAGCYSKAAFHEGRDVWFNKALTAARRALQGDPANVEAMVIAGASLVGLDRQEPAVRYLDEATQRDAERPDLRLALGRMHWQAGDRHAAVRELEQACRLAPQSWEAHAWLSQVLIERAEELRHPPRLHERARFHAVRALSLGPSPSHEAVLLHLLGVSCVQSERYDDAGRLFQRLIGYDHWKGKAEFYLGLVAYHAGRYHNAVMHLRRRLEDEPDDARVLARLGMCYLQLGETDRAREACNRALAVEPEHAGARWTLACSLLEEGRTDEAVKLLKELLADMPDHIPAFTEVVGVRRRTGDRRWLAQALRTEVSQYDRLPLSEVLSRPATRDVVTVEPRSVTLARIDVLVRALSDLDDEPVEALLEALELATDEHLRFVLWEHAVDLAARRRGAKAARLVARASERYGAASGRDVLLVARHVPEENLIRGLDLAEDDLRRAAVQRNPGTQDVSAHRRHVEIEREEARAWQAQLLVALGARGDRSAKPLLTRWASEADEDLGLAANAGLLLLGEAAAAGPLRTKAARTGATAHAEAFFRALPRPSSRGVSEITTSPDVACETCGRRTPDASWLVTGHGHAMCDQCLHVVARSRSEYAENDPAISCGICERDGVDAPAVFRLRGRTVCSVCLDEGLGWNERESVDRYLAGLRATAI